jgi:hypothetical protein
MSDPTCEVFKVINNQGGTRFWSKQGDDKTLTHTLFDSFNTGKISLPTDYEDRFYAAYVKDTRAGVKHYINEIRTPVFALFFDLDMLHTHAMDDVDLDRLMEAINFTVKRFFPTREHEKMLFTALFLGAPAKEISATTIKLGGHVIFPNINVTTVEARFIRVSLVNHLTTLFGEQYAAKGWDDAVDEVVYMRQGGGLRLIFSNKAEKCKDCRNAQTQVRNCDSCSRTGHILQGRPYTLRRVYTDGLYDDALQGLLASNLDKLVRYASIRRRESAVVTSGWKRYDGCPSYGVDEVIAKDSKKRKQRFGEDEAAMRKWKARPSVDRALLTVIQRTIRNAFRDFRKYDNIVVRSAVYGDDKLLWVHVDGDGSTACPNLLSTHNNGEHHSNHIWFSIDPRHLTLRCFCRCKTIEGRRGKPCSKFFVSKPLMQPEREAIFGDVPLLVKSGGGARGKSDSSSYLNKPASSFLKTLQAELYDD